MTDKTIQMDYAGRVVLPKQLRERFRLRGGDSLAVAVRGNAIELRPTRAAGKLTRVNGVLVFTATDRIEPATDLAAESREERIADLIHSSHTQP